MLWLVAAFFVTALLYAAVGFGGGSTYAALLAVSGVDYRLLPMIALACNIVVVAGSTTRFARAGITPWRGAIFLTLLAAPAALLGGLTPIEEEAFFLILGIVLLMTAGAMILPRRDDEGPATKSARLVPLAAVPLGYLAGLVGIGGGIFLAPLLHLTRWNTARAIAATASFFILINSIAGLTGQILKGGEGRFLVAISQSLPLLVAVAIGGQIGSLMAFKVLPSRGIRRLTAVLVAVVAIRLFLQF